VIAVEEEGHGRTQPTGRPLTAETSAGDVLAVLDRFNMETVDVLGFCAGGHTVIALALARPAGVRRLIAASTFAGRDAVPDEFCAMVKATLDDMPVTSKDTDRRLNPEPGHLERLFELDRRHILDFPGWSDEELGIIAVATLVVGADRDVVTAGYAARMAGAIPGARLLIISAGHGDYLGGGGPADDARHRSVPAAVRRRIRDPKGTATQADDGGKCRRRPFTAAARGARMLRVQGTRCGPPLDTAVRLSASQVNHLRFFGKGTDLQCCAEVKPWFGPEQLPL
jgi:pimeloyl-ACP methyl ester carboxylesterase